MRVTSRRQPARTELSPEASTSRADAHIRRSNATGEVMLARRARVWPLAVLGALLLGVLTADSADAAPQVVALAQDLTTVLNNIRNWLIGILASLATVFFTVGGVRYLAADGDPGEIGKAKQAFRSGAWGFGLAALAPVVVEILKGIVGAE